MRYDRTIVAYHGCDHAIAERILRGEPFKRSENAYDWLGNGIYFWEYGADRALRFADFQRTQHKVKTPAVVGALLQLGRCFDLMDTRYTTELAEAFPQFTAAMRRAGLPVPKNEGTTPDRKLRKRDCAMLNFYLRQLEEEEEPIYYDTVRCAFIEGAPAFPGSGIRHETHVQIAVRNPACIIGVFRPMMEVSR